MKQFFILLLMISMGSLFAQNLSLLDPSDTPIANGDTIAVMGDPSDFEIIAAIRVVNLSGSDMGVKCRKYEHSVYAGSTNLFCWYQCYMPTTFTPNDTVFILAHDTVDRFTGHLLPGGIGGTILMKYTFYSETNSNDSVSAYVQFTASGVGVNESQLVAITAAYPNPAREQVTFTYNVPTDQDASIVIQDLIGSVKYRYPLDGNQSSITVNLNDFSSGIYLYSLVVNGQTVSTKKLNIL